MGGYQCSCQQQTVYQFSTKSNSFLERSIYLLRLHDKLPKGNEEKEMNKAVFQQFNPGKSERQIIIIKQGEDKLKVVIQHEKYFYLGSYDNSLTGPGKLVIKDKLFEGDFKENAIFGFGQLIMKDYSNKKKIILKGQWGDKFQGHIIVEGFPYNLPFQINKSTIANQQNLYYIQYPNYDQYFGQMKNHLAQGEGMFIYRNNHPQRNYPIYIGRFQKGIRMGYGTLHYSQSKSLTINWKEGKPDGQGFFTLNNQKQSVTYKKGKRIQRIISQYLEQ